jgi:hypothetical protein
MSPPSILRALLALSLSAHVACLPKITERCRLVTSPTPPPALPGGFAEVDALLLVVEPEPEVEPDVEPVPFVALPVTLLDDPEPMEPDVVVLDAPLPDVSPVVAAAWPGTWAIRRAR